MASPDKGYESDSIRKRANKIGGVGVIAGRKHALPRQAYLQGPPQDREPLRQAKALPSHRHAINPTKSLRPMLTIAVHPYPRTRPKPLSVD